MKTSDSSGPQGIETDLEGIAVTLDTTITKL